MRDARVLGFQRLRNQLERSERALRRIARNGHRRRLNGKIGKSGALLNSKVSHNLEGLSVRLQYSYLPEKINT